MEGARVLDTFVPGVAAIARFAGSKPIPMPPRVPFTNKLLVLLLPEGNEHILAIP